MRGALVVCALAACGDDVVTPPASTWTLVQQAEPASLLAVWGTSASDVWVVGNRPPAQPTGGPTIYHYDGSGWMRVNSEQPSLDLWWVWGINGDDVWFGGSGGTLLRYHDGAYAGFDKVPTPRASGTIFGIWGAAANDVWAVGAGGSAGGIVWHWDGAQWTEPPHPADLPATMFKVQGRAANDVWFSGSDGYAMHWDGATLARVATGTTSPLFSVAVTEEVAIVVGGQSNAGEILESTGSDFAPVSLAAPLRWRGVAARGARAFAVGEGGIVAERGETGWNAPQQSPIQRNFHAAWIDPDGGLWGVGGKFEVPPQTDGFIIYYGTAMITEVEL
jgi:hypothetical protein